MNQWINIIGFSNPVNKTKYDLFVRYGFFPSGATINQRYKMLNGELDPYIFYEETFKKEMKLLKVMGP